MSAEDLTFPLAYEWIDRKAVVTVVYLCERSYITHGFNRPGWGTVCRSPVPAFVADLGWDGWTQCHVRARRITLEEAIAR